MSRHQALGENSPSLSTARLQVKITAVDRCRTCWEGSRVLALVSLPGCPKLASVGDSVLGSGAEQRRSGCSCILFFRTTISRCGQSFRLLIKFPLALNSESCRPDAHIFPHDEESTSINCHVTVRTLRNKNFMEKVKSS